jgi:hypothetical protein
MLSFALRTILAALALALGTMIGAAAIVLLAGDPGIPQAEGALPWQAGSWLVIAGTLVWIAHNSRIRGWRLAASLATLLFGVAYFNSIIEARFFGLISQKQLFSILGMSLIGAGVLGIALLAILRGLSAPPAAEPGWTPRVSVGRIAIGAFAYLAVYFTAGLAILPFIESFYAPRVMPSGLEVIAMQLLIRGPVFVALAILLVRMSAAPRTATIVMTGAALALLGGVAMLMVPNPWIPDATRWAHFVEVGVSNFVYGCFLGWLLTARSRTAAARSEMSASPVAP